MPANPFANLTATMSPADILYYGPAQREAILEDREAVLTGAAELTKRLERELDDARREAVVTATAERVAKLEQELEDAGRALLDAAYASYVAAAIARSMPDPIHGRRPGDVIVRSMNLREYLVLGVDATDGTAPRYFVVRDDERNAAPGEGRRPEYLPADAFDPAW